MGALADLIRSEPAVVWGAIGSLVTAGIAVGVAFGLNLSEQQATSINVFVGALGVLVTLLVIRSKVTPAAAPQPPAVK